MSVQKLFSDKSSSPIRSVNQSRRSVAFTSLVRVSTQGLCESISRVGHTPSKAFCMPWVRLIEIRNHNIIVTESRASKERSQYKLHIAVVIGTPGLRTPLNSVSLNCIRLVQLTTLILLLDIFKRTDSAPPSMCPLPLLRSRLTTQISR